MKLIKRARFVVQCWLAKKWLLYSMVLLVSKPRQRKLLVGTNTELVIEGFPRSGNTFAVVAFESAQDHPIRIAHHLHVQCQVFYAAKLNIPICIVIRWPEDVIRSSVTMSPYLTPGLLLRKYIEFYSDILKVKDKILFVRFEEVINDFGEVIERINKKFSREYQHFEPSEKNVAMVRKQIEHITAVQNRLNSGIAPLY